MTRVILYASCWVCKGCDSGAALAQVSCACTGGAPCTKKARGFRHRCLRIFWLLENPLCSANTAAESRIHKCVVLVPFEALPCHPHPDMPRTALACGVRQAGTIMFMSCTHFQMATLLQTLTASPQSPVGHVTSEHPDEVCGDQDPFQTVAGSLVETSPVWASLDVCVQRCLSVQRGNHRACVRAFAWLSCRRVASWR